MKKLLILFLATILSTSAFGMEEREPTGETYATRRIPLTVIVNNTDKIMYVLIKLKWLEIEGKSQLGVSTDSLNNDESSVSIILQGSEYPPIDLIDNTEREKLQPGRYIIKEIKSGELITTASKDTGHDATEYINIVPTLDVDFEEF